MLHMRRLLWSGPVAVAGAVAAVTLGQRVAVALMQPLPKAYALLDSAEPAVVTVVCVSAAVVVFAILAREAMEPGRTFRRTAAGVLAVSFLPDVALAMNCGARHQSLAGGRCLRDHPRCRVGGDVSVLASGSTARSHMDSER